MESYGVADVERLLGLSRATVRALVAAGFVKPARGARNSLRFSFQDLIALRTAQALAQSNVSPRRITKSLKELRRHLPAEMPLSGLRVATEGDHVVVREGGARWQADSGQYLLQFEGSPGGGSLTVIEAHAPQPQPDRPPPAAPDDDLDAHIDRGMALHEAGRLEEARTVYEKALAACGPDATLLFNMGVLLEDLNRIADAMEAYRAAIALDPDFADAHYNLGLLCRRAGREKEAIRHMSQYRRLTGGGL
jgi:tetratricopeptide (TPR) repeat protein